MDLYPYGMPVHQITIALKYVKHQLNKTLQV